MSVLKDHLNYIDWLGIRKVLKQQTFDFVDFFAGAGGMSYGFHKVGEETGYFRNIGAFDFDKHANKTYETNYGVRSHQLDLGNVEVSDIEDILASKRDKNNPLIVIGCAPCQGFSSHRKKDPRKDSRNSLVGRFAEIAVGLKADFIIMENVPDLLAKKHWHHFNAFKNILEAEGYNVTSSIVNMAEYGVPQERHRAVVLASKHFSPTVPAPVLTRGSFRTVKDAIGNLPPLKAGETSKDDSMHKTSNHRKETVEILKQVPKDGGSRPPGVGPACLDKVKGFYDVYGRLAWSKPSITMTARCRTPSCGRFTHPEQDRGLSIREAALLQGFPSDFIFEGPFDDKYKQVGNAVPPIFSTHLAAHVLTLMAGQNRSEEEENIEQPFFQSYSSVIAHLKQQRN
ncbi:DNA (cytosine-5)-methyltransferase 1 [Paenibacillus sp. 1_12]|uniref:DNA cytosine methyltransferase n=1 Tax=Paenibacillus sp. 1_12 TaxID=1566278 RepID=UPI0008E0F5C2|nr:DNA cytosine methyltransferase [Paenibacillus sp. 1_12]SFK75881.1 DNA (cytosine-5)-methyltransferase 1 [Paenibacillus sp. 1_12]